MQKKQTEEGQNEIGGVGETYAGTNVPKPSLPVLDEQTSTITPAVAIMKTPTSAAARVKAPLLEQLDVLIIQASEEERQHLIQNRKEIIEQNKSILDDNHRRWKEKVEVYSKTFLSTVGFGAGVYMATHSFPYPGVLTIGATLFSIAPEFVMKFFGKGVRDDK